MKKLLICLLALLLAASAGAEGLAGMANPWITTTREDMEARTGLCLQLPEGAQEAVWRVLTTANMAEVQFTLNGAHCVARCLPSDFFRDISGMYYDWTAEATGAVGWCEATVQTRWSAEERIELCLWYDAAPGLMYALAVTTPAGEALDALAVAELVWLPAQGEADADPAEPQENPVPAD